MSQTHYYWRRLTTKQREDLLKWRRDLKRPWHSPPHRPNFGRFRFHISAACYEHAPHIGHSVERMEAFSATLLDTVRSHSDEVFCWCVLPNHYHVLVNTPNVLRLVYELGRLHGRTSHLWNTEEDTRGRKVFHRATERVMRSDRHFLATVNYIHHNPVHHRYVERWTEWPWSSAADYLATTGRDEAERIWREHPLLGYGAKWDAPEM